MNIGQLPLAMRWPHQQRFESYFVGDNGPTVELLRSAAGVVDAGVAGTSWVFLSGAQSSGKSHLLIAACAAASEAGRSAQYISLRAHAGDPKGMGPATEEAIRALGGSDVLAIDDVDAIAGDRGAEHALFDLYNRCKVENSTMLFAAAQAPAHCGIGLPDLVSRLASCAQGPLKPLGDEQRREVVRARAHARGVVLEDDALEWLFTYTPRDLASLVRLVERIDRASLAAKRRVTIPFLKKLLAEDIA
jgi:DnaA family protein